AGHFGQHGSLVPRTGTDFENSVARMRAQQLGHHGYDKWLGDGLPISTRKRAIDICLILTGRRDKPLSLYLAHRLERRPMVDTPRLQLLANHLLAKPVIIL